MALATQILLRSFGLSTRESPEVFSYIDFRRLWRAVIAEIIATAWLVYISIGISIEWRALLFTPAGSNITAKATFFLPSAGQTLLLAISQGFTLSVIAFNFSKISGGHANPTVTLAWVVTGRFKWGVGLLYVMAQVSGAFLGAAVMMISTPRSQWGKFGSTSPQSGTPVWKAFLMEIVLTFVKTHTSLSAHDAELVRSGMPAISPLPAGFILMACVLIGSGFSGASMNPTRSLAAAVVSANWDSFWIYWTAPFIGAIIAGVLVRWVWWTRPFIETEIPPDH